MESSASFSFKKSPRSSSSSSSSLLLTTVIPVELLILLSSFLFSHHPHSSTPPPLTVQPPPPSPPHSFVKSTNTATLYPYLCFKDPRLLSKGVYRDHVPSWKTAADRRLMQTTPKISPPTVIVARDGTRNFTTVVAAVVAAPSRGKGRHVIQIKVGIYNENLLIPRNKANIMLVGEGMNSTIITSNKNFVDGYTTFTSATLTVIRNNFLARDLTIMNTSGPEKHQAVALRVTSDAAFYHCQFISHQDTLYAHSLSQLYRECSIHGTIDFIFGNTAAIFERCIILVRKPILGQKNEHMPRMCQISKNR